MPGPESPRPNPVVESIDKKLGGLLRNPEFVSGILSSDPKINRLKQNIARSLTEGLNSLETGIWVTRLLQIMSKDDKAINQDKRDAALEILKLSRLDRVNKPELLNVYLKLVESQNENSDPLGTVSSLLEAGKVIGLYLPHSKETKARIETAWKQVADKLPNSEINIEREATKITQIINVDDEPEKLGYREKPILNPEQQAIHDKYLEICARDGSLKLSLWRNTAGFRSLAQRYGIDLSQFWNIHSPEQIAQAAIKLKASSPEAISIIDRELKKLTGITLGQLGYEEARVISDQIIAAVKQVTNQINANAKTFEPTLNKLRSFSQDPRLRDPKFRKNINRAVINFFRENGIELEVGQDPFSLISDEEIVAKASENYTHRQRLNQAIVEAIDHLFLSEPVDTRFEISGRTREDLFLGDLSGDCTAYHLNVGMNAWTTPVWFSNPGFSMFTIKEGNRLISKFGIYLALENNVPVLVIDSVEAGKGIEDEESAKKSIKEGLSFIEKWARRVGVKSVYINNTSNSSDLSSLLSGTSDDSQISDGLEILGGVSGTTEFQQKAGLPVTTSSMYVQSEMYDEDLERDSLETERRRNIAIGYLEKIISSTINKAAPEQVLAINEARTDWPNLFKLLMDSNLPDLHKYMDTSWSEFEGIISKVKYDPITGQKDFSQFGSENWTYENPDLPDILSERLNEELNRQMEAKLETKIQVALGEPEVIGEARNDYLNGILEVIKILEANGLTPQDALIRLYGEREDMVKNVEGKIILQPLPKLKSQ